MLIRSIRNWEIPEREATPEAHYLNRRRFFTLAGATSLLAACEQAAAPVAQPPDLTSGLYPATRNEAYTLDRPITAESLTSRYNNFYEFGSHKQIADAAQRLRTRPWEIRIDGEVDKPLTFGIDELIKQMGVEERLYRLRCVETWAMAIPWTGFPLSKLVALAQPKPGSRYVLMTSFQDSTVASGQRQFWYPWPYTEGMTMAEAQNELAFMVTGAYGKPLAKQFGAPLRLALPWKYGFKSIKSVQRITFTSQRPVSFWEKVQASEYGFWANVNPSVPHPRWSQANELVLGETSRRPTQLFNGYAAQVAELYRGLESETLYR